MPEPFARDPAKGMFYESKAHAEALARLHLMLQSGTLGVLTGEVGAGKSTLIRHLAASLDPLRFQMVYLAQAGMRPKDFYGDMLRHMGEESPYFTEKAKELFHRTLLNRAQQQERSLVVFIDEAQDVSPALLLEMRFALNQHMDATSLFSLILVGQPELRRILKANRYEALTQRVKLQFHLAGLTESETAQYIRQQMKGADLSKPLFADSAIKAIYGHTRGILRQINALCGHALYGAKQTDSEVIEHDLVNRIIMDYSLQRGT